MNATQEGYMDFVLDLDEKINMEEHMLVYDGFVDQEITKTFANKVNKILEETGVDYLVSKRIYHIMIECFQNINRHSDDPPHTKMSFSGVRGYISVGRTTDDYFVTTGNYINNDKVDNLEKRLEDINGMDKDEVKKLYKQALREAKLNDSGGAGLGFIDMKKRTNNNIGYKFKKVDDKTSFVVLNVKVGLA